MRTLNTIALGCLLALGSGCVTAPDGTQTMDINRVARISGAAAYLGGALDLARNPDHRPAYVAVVATLRSMEDSQNYDASEFASALQGLQIRELQGPEGTLYIQAALLVWDEILSVARPLTQEPFVAAALPQVRSGLERALAN